MSEPYIEEDIEDQVIHNWLDHFEMQFHQLHAYRHMNKQQITGPINYIKPKRIFPIHTENQQLSKKSVETFRLQKTEKNIHYDRARRVDI